MRWYISALGKAHNHALNHFCQKIPQGCLLKEFQCSSDWRWPFVFVCFVLFCWSLLYSAILRSRTDSLRSHVILHERIVLFYFIERFWISTKVVYLQRWHGWCHMKLLPSQRVLCYTPYNTCSVSLHAKPQCIRKADACLVVTHFSSFQERSSAVLFPRLSPPGDRRSDDFGDNCARRWCLNLPTLHIFPTWPHDIFEIKMNYLGSNHVCG